MEQHTTYLLIVSCFLCEGAARVMQHDEVCEHRESYGEVAFAGWPDYPYASLFALVTIIVVLFLEHLVSMAYEKRVLRQLGRPHSPGAVQPLLLLTFCLPGVPPCSL